MRTERALTTTTTTKKNHAIQSIIIRIQYNTLWHYITIEQVLIACKMWRSRRPTRTGGICFRSARWHAYFTAVRHCSGSSEAVHVPHVPHRTEFTETQCTINCAKTPGCNGDVGVVPSVQQAASVGLDEWGKMQIDLKINKNFLFLFIWIDVDNLVQWILYTI